MKIKGFKKYIKMPYPTCRLLGISRPPRTRYSVFHTQAGFVLTFSVLVAGILVAIGIALYGITIKELVLSSTGRDSQFAFYAADTGGECALYWDIKHPGFSGSAFAPVETTSGSPIGEAGITAPTSGTWITVSLQDSYSNPLVFAMSNTENGGQSPKLAQVRNVQSSSFEARLCEHENTDGACDGHVDENIGYVVLERDAVDELSSIEAGIVTPSEGSTDGDEDATTINFDEDLGSEAIIIATQQTQLEPGEGIVQAANVSGTSADLYLCDHAESSVDDCESHGAETVAWVAFDPGNIPLSTNHVAGITAMTDSLWTNQSFSAAFDNPPVVVGTVQTNNGGQQAKPVMARDIFASDMDIRYCEHDSGDDCDSHNSEDVGWLAVKEGTLSSVEETGKRYADPIAQGSGLFCNEEDITDPATGWDPDNGWNITTTGNPTTTVFDMAFDNGSCATVTVVKGTDSTRIDSRGYNTCPPPVDPRRLERGLRITY